MENQIQLTLVLVVSLVVPLAPLDHKVVVVGVVGGKVAAGPLVRLVAGTLRGVGPEEQLPTALHALLLEAERRSEVEGHLRPEGQQQDDDQQEQGAQAGGGHVQDAALPRQTHQGVEGASAWKQQG